MPLLCNVMKWPASAEVPVASVWPSLPGIGWIYVTRGPDR